MKFESKKDLFFSITILGINTFLIGMIVLSMINGDMEKDEYWTLILIIPLILFLFWLYFGTNYELSKENGLIYRCGPFNGKISVDRITEIVKGKTLWVGFKPATSRKGLIVKYDKYNEIYISPKTNETFIKNILELKKDIIIKE